MAKTEAEVRAYLRGDSRPTEADVRAHLNGGRVQGPAATPAPPYDLTHDAPYDLTTDAPARRPLDNVISTAPVPEGGFLRAYYEQKTPDFARIAGQTMSVGASLLEKVGGIGDGRFDREVSPTMNPAALLRSGSDAAFRVAGEQQARVDERWGGGMETAGKLASSLSTTGQQVILSALLTRRALGLPKNVGGLIPSAAVDEVAMLPFDIATTERPEDSSSQMFASMLTPDVIAGIADNVDGDKSWANGIVAGTLSGVQRLAEKANETRNGRLAFEAAFGVAADVALRGIVGGGRALVEDIPRVMGDTRGSMVLPGPDEFPRVDVDLRAPEGTGGDDLAGKAAREGDVPPVSRETPQDAAGARRAASGPNTPPVARTTPEAAPTLADAPPADPPVPPTLADPPAPPPKAPSVVSLNNAGSAEVRAWAGIDELPAAERQPFIDAWQEAGAAGMADDGLVIAQEAVKRGRGMTPVEYAAAMQYEARLVNQIEFARETLAEADQLGNDVVAGRERARLDHMLAELEVLTEASKRSGSNAARALAALRYATYREDYSLVRGIEEARKAKGARLDAEDRMAIETETRKVADLEAENSRLRQENERLAIKRQEELALAVLETETRRRRMRGPNRVQEIQAERANLKNDLAKLGIRLNDITGVSSEGLYLIGRLAVNYIEEGAMQAGARVDLNEIVDRVLRELNNPAISRRDVLEALNARNPKAKAAAKSAARRQVDELKRQARLLTKIEDAENGIFAPARKRPPSSAEVQTLQSQLTRLRRAAYSTGLDSARLEKALESINQLQDQLANHHRAIKAKRAIPSDDLRELQARIRGLRQEMSVEDRLTDLEHQLSTGEFKMPVRRVSQYTTPELERNQVALARAKKEWRQAIEGMRPMSKTRMLGEVGALGRMVLATADWSAALFQAGMLSTRYPKMALAVQRKAIQAFFSENTSDQIENWIRQHPDYFYADQAKLGFTEVGGTVGRSEEFFMSSLFDKSPAVRALVSAGAGAGTGYTLAPEGSKAEGALLGAGAGVVAFPRLAAMSERHMSTTLNMMRFGAFRDFITRYPNSTLDERVAFANAINVFSGRGDLNLGIEKAAAMKQAGDILAGAFFAPKLAASRIQTPMLIFQHWQQPRVRKEIAKQYVAAVATGMSVLWMADMAGLEVGTDPESPDWGRIRFGDTRIDIWAGFQQPARIVARLAVGGANRARGIVSGDDTVEPPPDPLELLGRFSAFKLAPIMTVPNELFRGVNAVGDEVTLTETAAGAVTPLILQDIAETWRIAGPETAAATGAMNFLGVRSSTYKDSESAVRRRIRARLQDGENAEAGALVREWNRENPDNRIRSVDNQRFR